MGRSKYLAERTNTSGSRVGQIKLRREHTWPRKNHLIHKKAAAHRMSDHGMGNPSGETAPGCWHGHGFSWWKTPFFRIYLYTHPPNFIITCFCTCIISRIPQMRGLKNKPNTPAAQREPPQCRWWTSSNVIFQMCIQTTLFGEGTMQNGGSGRPQKATALPTFGAKSVFN